ncbi:MAG: Immunogenic 75 kDa protein [Chlorobi bacterium]|nr:Immunogenic 75 kDa protein [Chlorobiota bacterium]
MASVPGVRWTLALFATLIVLAFHSTTLLAQPENPSPAPASPDSNLSKFKIRNVGFVVNTKELEYAPTITADGRTLYFVSNRAGGVGGHDFWFTTKKERLDSVYSTPVNLGKPVNTELNEGVASIAADGQTIFFTGCNRPDGLGDCDLYEAELDGSEWKNVRNVSEINSPYWDSQPSISSDGKTLYFVSNRPGALGGDGDADIYVSTLGADGRWSAPKNLGEPINTPEREDSPFIIAGSGALYFSSAGHGGEGGLDFFVSKRMPDGTFSKPENLGPPFNTSKDERFITLPAAGDIVYFSSERTDLDNAGKLDLFVGLLPPRIINVLVAGRVFDQCTQGNLPADLVFINEGTGDTLNVSKTNTSTGQFSFVTVGGKAMTIRVIGRSAGYPGINDTITVPATDKYLEIKKNFPLGEQPVLSATYQIAPYIQNLPPSAPAKYRDFRGLLIEEVLVKELYPLLTYVFFDSGSAKIPDRYVLFTDPSQTAGFSDTTIPGGTLQKYYHMLNIVGYRMTTHPETKIQIVGCNSEQAAIGEVMDVSGKRGQTVYDYLINIWKIDPSRIKLLPPRGLPEAKSNPNDPLGIVENRRTEIRSDDWDVVKPIVNIDFRRFPQPDTMHFQMKNGINDGLIARRAIEIKRNGEIWHVMNNVGKTDVVSPSYSWGKADDPDSIPNNETPYTAQLVVYSQDGKECRSAEIQIPVEIVTNEEKRRERLVDSTRDIYSLVLFKFNSPEAGPLNDRILREFIYNDVRPGARIEVIGHTDVVGLDDANLRLSQARAKTVTDGIRKNVKSGVFAHLDGKGVGELDALYPNELPEGRFYNRTVQVKITTPSGVAQ